MFLLVILGFTVALTSASDEETSKFITPPVTPPCNCSHLLNAEGETEVYPTFPPTSFTCWGRYDGYYADIEVDCTIFHYCQTWHFPTGLNETVKWDFACPQSTIFNQKILSCTPPSVSFDCQESPNYYWVNYYNLTSTTPETTPLPEASTPGSNFGQQLIVGGLQPQTAEFQESSDSSSTASPSSQETATEHLKSEAIQFPEEPSIIPSYFTSSDEDFESLSQWSPEETSTIHFPPSAKDSKLNESRSDSSAISSATEVVNVSQSVSD